MAKNFYEVLGVDKKASKDEIKKAFYKLAHQHHPDKNGGNDAKFKEVNEAYQTLSDDTKRAQYDRFGTSGPGGFGGAQGGNPFEGFDFGGFGGFGAGASHVEFDMSDLGDMFGDMFGFGGGRSAKARRGRGDDLQVAVQVTLEEVYTGAKKTISYRRHAPCKTCSGEGFAPGSKNIECKKCSGKGSIKSQKQTIFGTFASSAVCPDCEGHGKVPEKKCTDCHGKGIRHTNEEVEVKIPEGIEDGAQLLMRGFGESVKSGTAGDLYIVVRVLPHKVFTRRGANLYMSQTVKLSDMLLGKKIELDILGYKETVEIPELTSVQKEFVVKGKGMNVSGRRGDLVVQFALEMPKRLSGAEKELVMKLKDLGM